MKYHGARQGYDPKKVDERRQLNTKDDPSSWPFPFSPIEIKAAKPRSDRKRLLKKRPLHRRRKHGRPA